MIDSEKYLNERIGRTNPFRVPTGYFDNLSQRVMASIPETSPKAVIVDMRRRRWMNATIAVAATVCFAIFGAAVYFPHASNTATTQRQLATATATTQDNTATSESYVDQVVDYTMMDNSDIYAYLASE